MRRSREAAVAVLLPLAAALAFAAAASPVQAQPHHRSCLAPTGGDDTEVLQAALDRCSGSRGHCSVELCAGVFQTGILRVSDFRGTLHGAGARATVLRARSELSVSDLPGFFREDPFSPDADPWPYLLQFVEGRGQVRDLGVLIPTPPEGSRPTTGWTLFEGTDPTYELRGAILFTGRDAVDFALSRVRVEAEPDPASDLGTTAFGGIEFGGLLFDPEAPEPFPVFPARGRFRLSDSEAAGVLSGTPLGELAQATVRVSGNRYRSVIAVDVIDADRSQISIRSNRWRVSYRGVQVLQNLDGAPSLGSTILVDGNHGRLEPLFPGMGEGVAYQDPFEPARGPGDSILWVTRNRFDVGDETAAAVAGVTAKGAARLRLLANRISGAADVGLDVDDTSECLVFGNALGRLDARENGPHLRLGFATSDCLAVVGREDRVEDHGSNNRVFRW